MIKNNRYKEHLKKKGFLKLPMFRKLLVLTAPNGETVARDFHAEEKVVQVISVTDSSTFPDALCVETSEGFVNIVISDNFEISKNALKLLAEKEEISVFWLDKEMLDFEDGDNNEELIDILSIEGLRKWIYCPHIAEGYNEWVELVVRDIGSAEEYQIEKDDLLCASTIEFEMRDENVLPDVINQQFSLNVNALSETLGLDNTESQRQILSAAIIVIQGVYEESIKLSKLAHRMINVLRLSNEAKVFLQYHAQTINWETMELDVLKSTLPVYRIEGLVDFIESVNASEDEIQKIENSLRSTLQLMKSTISVLPGLKIIENESTVTVDRREWRLKIQASNHFDAEQFISGESPEYIGKVIQRLCQMEMTKKQWIREGTRIFQCVMCDFIQEHKHNCEACGGTEMVSRIPASIQGHRFSIQDAVKTLMRSH